MASLRKVLLFEMVLLISVKTCCGQNCNISESIKNIFLSETFNSTNSEWILKSARESYLLLKEVEKGKDAEEKLNFVQNYADFLLKLFQDLRTKELDIYHLFSKENSFLKDYKSGSSGPGNVNISEVRISIENLQIAAEQHLIVHYNNSDDSYNVPEVLALDDSSFDAFLKEKLRADYSEIGYFFLEVFATLIGLSWGIISTALHYTDASV